MVAFPVFSKKLPSLRDWLSSFATGKLDVRLSPVPVPDEPPVASTEGVRGIGGRAVFHLISRGNRSTIALLLTRLTRRKASVGLFIWNLSMPAEPAVKRAIAFIDGQNLYHNARSVFGYTFPNYDVQKLAQAVCAPRGWTLSRVQFYTGVPSPSDNAFWNGFWSNKLAMMGRRRAAAIARTAAKSPSDAMGNPASMTSTPRRSS